MKKVVLDTSVVVKWFSNEKGSNEAKIYLKQLQQNKIKIFLPELLKYEMANALLKGKKLSPQLMTRVLDIFYKLPINFIVEEVQSAKLSYKLAEKLKITFYDACYLILAKKLKADLITANPRHQKNIRGVKVISIRN